MKLSAKLWQSVAKNYAKLLEEEETSDVSITVGSGEDVKTFYAHSLILRTQTPYFHTALSAQWGKREGDKMFLSKPNVTPAIFEDILNELKLDDKDVQHLLGLLSASDELILPTLSEHRHHPYASGNFFKSNYGKIAAYRASLSKYATTRPNGFKRVIIGP
ncbi:8085_t:CDS:2 [Funneliformis mosseae]|uniref:8085_t:CDS:1 n=1 Tax=Funneliformis mosseae TaxID=27381 RepID=A0A9N8ZN27_FUNMO|nr:8085_t:CDS:2 [Funneliformis mosseae]